MKLLSALLIVCVNVSAFAQPTVITHLPPSGYSVPQMQKQKSIAIDAQNNVWVTFAGVGLGKYDQSTWIMYNTSNCGIPGDTTTSLVFDGSGNLWVGTSQGLGKMTGSTWTVYNTQNSGLVADSITCLSSVGSNLYIGTYYGFCVFDGTNFTSYSTANGLISDSVTSIDASPSGTVYVGTRQGFSVFNGSVFSNYNTSNSNFPVNHVIDVKRSVNGFVWIVLDQVELYYLDVSGQIHSYCDDFYYGALDCNTYLYSRLCTDANGYVLTIDKFYDILELNDSYVQYFTYYGMFYGFYPDLAYDNNGNIWVASTPSGGTSISFLKSTSLSGYTPTYGYANNNNTKDLNINDVEAMVLNRGDMHWDVVNTEYEVPAGSGKSSVFASSLWIGGLDAGGNLHVAGMTYRQTGLDYYPGPIDGMIYPFDSTGSLNYDLIWSVYRYQVDDFILNYQNGSVSNGTYPIPNDILTWPAIGNFGITDDKAPFVDANSDNLYNPYDGDYPLIKGDQMLFWIFNDSLWLHTETSGEKLGVEVHASAFAYNCIAPVDSVSVIDRTTLYHYRIINKSPNDYDSVYVGFWCDMDLGNYTDDYVGCDSTRAAGFTYNGDADDDGQFGYGLMPPIQNVKILRGTLADPGDGTDNDLDGTIDEPGERTTMNHFMKYDNINNVPTGNPGNPMDYYNLMKSTFFDGTHLTHGGIPGGVSSNFYFSGTPYTSGWNEANSGNVPNDRRFVMGSGPVSLDAGGELNFDIAYVFTRDTTGPNGLTTSIARNILDLDRIQLWFDTDSFPCLRISAVGLNEQNSLALSQLMVYPNPASEYLTLKSDLILIDSQLEIRDVMGKVIWSGRYSGQELDIHGLAPGTYIVRLTDKQGALTAKFLKW